MARQDAFEALIRGHELFGKDPDSQQSIARQLARIPVEEFEAVIRGEIQTDPDTPVFTTLAELYARPELLKPPQAIIPRIAYRGRMVGIAAPEKAGKSTLVGHAASALTKGRYFLGEKLEPGRVVWVGLEEAPGDAVRRFMELDADGSRVQMVTSAPKNLLGAIRSLLAEWPADLLVVDSLQEYARITQGEGPKSGDASAWAAVVRPLVAVTREFDIAGQILHHTRRSDGKYRDSGEIGAAMDAMLEMYLPGTSENPNIRHIKGRGRWPIEPFDMALREGRYEMPQGGELSLDTLILIHVENNPGTSVAATRKAVQKQNQTVVATLNTLEARGAIVNRGTKERPRYHAPSPGLNLEVA